MTPLQLTPRFIWVPEVVGHWLCRGWYLPDGTEVCRTSYNVRVVGRALCIDDGGTPAHILKFDSVEQAKQAGEAHVALNFEEFPAWVRNIREMT